MPRRSAGLLAYRHDLDGASVLLAHPGGPLWARRDTGSWSVPKGEYDADRETPEVAARREFAEEVGVRLADDLELASLGEVRQSGGKIVTAFAVEQDLDPTSATSNHFEMEWPRGSGVTRSFPEVDRVAWFDLETAAQKILMGQRPLLDRLSELLERPR